MKAWIVIIWTDTTLRLGYKVVSTATTNSHPSVAVSPPLAEDLRCGRHMVWISKVVGRKCRLNPSTRCGSGHWCLEVGVATTIPSVDRIPRVNVVSESMVVYSFGFEGKGWRIARCSTHGDGFLIWLHVLRPLRLRKL